MKKITFLQFIKSLLVLALPIIFQQLMLNLASLLDTFMVGQIDEISTSGVFIATRITFIVSMLVFGGTEGGSVFFGQFYGAKNDEGMRKATIYKFGFTILLASISLIVVEIFGYQLASLFSEDSKVVEIAYRYLQIIAPSFILYAIIATISSTLRDDHNVIIPTIGSVIGVSINTLFNYLLIFGKLGFPTLGSVGAAIGTFIERIVESAFFIIYLVFKKPNFIKNIFKDLRINKKLFFQLNRKSIPLALNEFLWSLGQITIVFFFSQVDSLSTVSLPIATTIFDMSFIFAIALGTSISIIVGNTLGSGEIELAKIEARYSIYFTIIISVILGGILMIISPYVVNLYGGVGESAKELASYFIFIYGIYLLINSFNTISFFLFRAGGKSYLVFLFDSVFTWVILIPLGFIFMEFLNLDIKTYFVLIYGLDILKMILGLIVLLSNKWYKNLMEVKYDG